MVRICFVLSGFFDLYLRPPFDHISTNQGTLSTAPTKKNLIPLGGFHDQMGFMIQMNNKPPIYRCKSHFPSKENDQNGEFWQGQQGSNPRPTVLETVALPTELYPYGQGDLVKLARKRKPKSRKLANHMKNFAKSPPAPLSSPKAWII